MQTFHVEFDCMASLSFLSSTDLVMESPFSQDIAASEISHLLFSLIHELSVDFGPLCEELIEALHLLSAPVIHRLQLLLLNVYVPITKRLSTSLDASVSIQIFLKKLIDELVTPEVQEAILDLDVIQVEHTNTRLHGNLSKVSQRHALCHLRGRDHEIWLFNAAVLKLCGDFGHSKCKGFGADLTSSLTRWIRRRR